MISERPSHKGQAQDVPCVAVTFEGMLSNLLNTDTSFPPPRRDKTAAVAAVAGSEPIAKVNGIRD